MLVWLIQLALLILSGFGVSRLLRASNRRLPPPWVGCLLGCRLESALSGLALRLQMYSCVWAWMCSVWIHILLVCGSVCLYWAYSHVHTKVWVSVCVCGICLSSCHVSEEVALYCAIRAVSLQAGLAIWTHDKEPGPGISHFFNSSQCYPISVSYCCLSTYQSTMIHCILTMALFFSFLLSVFLHLSVYFILSESLSSYPSPLSTFRSSCLFSSCSLLFRGPQEVPWICHVLLPRSR